MESIFRKALGEDTWSKLVAQEDAGLDDFDEEIHNMIEEIGAVSVAMQLYLLHVYLLRFYSR